MERLVRDGVALAYEEAGSGDPPLLLVHCWTCNHSFFAPQLEHFSRTQRVVSVDLRGHGESDKPRQDYTVAGFSDDLAWLCEQLGVVKPVVIGHSMGGNIALELAARYPDLAAAIVMVDSAILLPPDLLEGVKPVAASLHGPGFREAQREFVGGYPFFLSTDDPTRKSRILDVMSSAPQHVMANALDQHILLWDGAAAAAACKAPALYIGATAFLSDIARFRDLCPQLVLGQTVGAGHFNNQEVPEQVNAMIERFLATALAVPQRGL